MRVFHIGGERFSELDAPPAQMPESGFVWIGVAREAFEERLPEIQAALMALAGGGLLDLHVSDLLNRQLPSHYDYTSRYELVVFRRLRDAPPPRMPEGNGAEAAAIPQRMPESIETTPVGCVVFDRVLLSVHSAGCTVRDHFAQRLPVWAGAADGRAPARLPTQPADLMLRMVNHMVDGFLDLRRQLTRRFGELQEPLLDSKSRFTDWQVLLESRSALHLIEDLCEDQRGAVQEWLDSLEERPEPDEPHARREHELLSVRSRDVIEHIERVLAHVRRLEQSAEAAVQMHFSALGHRTNNTMRTLTVLTAVFLPLNLITGFFGMNFDSLPLIHSATGLWVAFGTMVVIGLGLSLYFWRKRYLGRGG